MTRAAWLTDVHLNFLSEADRRRFAQELRELALDMLLVSGDIAESQSLGWGLMHLAAGAACRVCFVLGNHDFYHGSIGGTRARVVALQEEVPQLTYLTASSVVELGPNTALVGHDGWGDARLGDFLGSNVMLNDYLLINELQEQMSQDGQGGLAASGEPWARDRRPLQQRLQALGDEAADHFRHVVPLALASHRRVITLIHAPPFREACRYNGRVSDDHWAPHFSCGAAGAAFRELMEAQPDREMLVLCGHTHAAADVQILPNLRVLCGAAQYGQPVIQQVFEFD